MCFIMIGKAEKVEGSGCISNRLQEVGRDDLLKKTGEVLSHFGLKIKEQSFFIGGIFYLWITGPMRLFLSS